jgi:hypothetical protein
MEQVLVERDARESAVNTHRGVYCSRSMPDSWRIRPSTVANDFGWIVGRPRRSRTAARPPSTANRSLTNVFIRAQLASSPPTGMP